MNELAQRRLAAMLGPELLAALEAYIDERIREGIAAALAHVESSAPRWLTLEQAGELLGCSPDAVRMRVKRGRLESRRQGARLYVSRQSLDQLGRAA